MNGLTRQIVLLVSAATMLITNLGFGTDDFSDSTVEDTIYNNLSTAFTPAAYTFVVWLPIFLGCAIFAIYQALPAQRDDRRLDALGWPLAVAFLSNAIVPLFQSDPASLMLVVDGLNLTLMLGALILAYVTALRLSPQDRAFRWLVRLPVVLFLSWIAVATTLNWAQVLTGLSWSGFGVPDVAWAMGLVAVVTAVGAAIVWTQREIAFGLVVIWGLIGIAVAQMDQTSLVVTIVLASLVLAGAIFRRTLGAREMPAAGAA